MKFVKFYKCPNQKCYWKAAFNADKAHKYGYRCIACMTRLNECELLYVEYSVGNWFIKNKSVLFILVSLILSGSVVYLDKPNFGGVIHNPLLSFLVVSLLMLGLLYGVYSRILGMAEIKEKEVEDNMRPLNSAVLAIFCCFFMFLVYVRL